MTLANTIIYGSKQAVENFLQQEPDIDINETDEYGFTPLIEAAIANKTDIGELLLQHGANANLADATLRYPLHWTVDNHNLAFSKLLLQHKADANAYNRAGQTPLVLPLLRQQNDLKQLLYHWGASVDFALDYINTKLLGHRFELQGHVHIVDPASKFILLDLEGFLFEFTSSFIQNSLERFKNNFAARDLSSYFKKIDEVIDIFKISSELIKYQQYTINLNQLAQRIDFLATHNPLLIPISYEGHAITCVRYNNILIKCDRGAYSNRLGQSVIIYKINNLREFTHTYVKNLLYTAQSEETIHLEMNQLLDLKAIDHLTIPPQITGNCSWANVEAAIAALIYILFLRENPKASAREIDDYKTASLNLFNRWREWDKDRALDECIQSFWSANNARKAAKAEILGSILVHCCKYTDQKDLDRAAKILRVLKTPGYEYVLESYLKIFTRQGDDPIGNNLKHLLDLTTLE